jgi:hypothetical protein
MLACSTWNKEIIEFAKENLNVHIRTHFSIHTFAPGEIITRFHLSAQFPPSAKQGKKECKKVF